MVTIEQQLLGALLDRYEHSVGFVAGRGQQRRILLHLYGYRQNDFPLYDIDDSGARKAVNAAAQALANQGLVSVEWMPGQEGHILRRVALELSAVLQAYALAGRQPLSDIVTGLERQLTALSENVGADWARQYLQEQLDFLARNRRPSAAFPMDSTEQKEWLTVLREASAQRLEPMLERVFSIRFLGDSKAFALRHRTRLLSVLKKHLPLDTVEMTDEELLRQIGLERYPELFSLAGSVSFRWPDGRLVDAAPLSDGLHLSARDAAIAQPILSREVDTLLFIENKANYYAQIRNHFCPRTVVVFHGGCYSPQRGQFFRRLCQSAGSSVRLLHWGDIDLGGFEMDSRLRREIDPRFVAWQMGCEELRSHREQAISFSAEYALKLVTLLADPYLHNSYDVIRYMLSEGIRLEQEALL